MENETKKLQVTFRRNYRREVNELLRVINGRMGWPALLANYAYCNLLFLLLGFGAVGLPLVFALISNRIDWVRWTMDWLPFLVIGTMVVFLLLPHAITRLRLSTIENGNPCYDEDTTVQFSAERIRLTTASTEQAYPWSMLKDATNRKDRDVVVLTDTALAIPKSAYDDEAHRLRILEFVLDKLPEARRAKARKRLKMV